MGPESDEIPLLVQTIVQSFNSNPRVALGFESPLFVPVSEKHTDLGKSRDGESNRPWSAGGGAAVLATGIAQAAWILRELHREMKGDLQPYLDWTEFAGAGSGLFLWEAFVTGNAKSDSHTGDALLAAKEFQRRSNKSMRSDVTARNPMSLIGAALLWSGLSKDLDFLQAPAVVIKPSAA